MRSRRASQVVPCAIFCVRSVLFVLFLVGETDKTGKTSQVLADIPAAECGFVVLSSFDRFRQGYRNPNRVRIRNNRNTVSLLVYVCVIRNRGENQTVGCFRFFCGREIAELLEDFQFSVRMVFRLNCRVVNP